MTADIPLETSAPRAVSDNAGLSTAQADSFKDLEDFGSIRTAMSDTTSSALPGLEIMDSAAGSQAPGGDGGRRNDRPILQPQPGNELPSPPLDPTNPQQQLDNRNKPPIDDRNKPDPEGQRQRRQQ